jgi:UDP-N-acetylglucosamine acyltransferase
MTKIHPTAIIDPCVEIGENVEIGPYCVIGTEGQIRDGRDKGGFVVIGDNCRIRSHVTIHRGSEGRATVIGSDAYIMAMTHIGHDVVIGRHLTLATGAVIGGHCRIGKYVTIGLNAAIHQRIEIGDYCMIGMNTPVTRHIPSTLKVAGNPCRILGHNTRYEGYEKYSEYLQQFTSDPFLSRDKWLTKWRNPESEER